MEILAFGDKSVSATMWKPIQSANRLGRNHNTIMHTLMAIVIISALARTYIEEFASKARVQKFIGVFILELDEAALAAPITQRLPFLAIEFIQRLVAPKLICRSTHHEFLLVIVMDLPENQI